MSLLDTVDTKGWTPDQPLRADATDEQMVVRFKVRLNSPPAVGRANYYGGQNITRAEADATPDRWLALNPATVESR